MAIEPNSQVHAYEANTPRVLVHCAELARSRYGGRDGGGYGQGRCRRGDLHLCLFLYRYDASYAVEVQRAHPGRFAIVKPVDPDDPAVADVVADWKNTPGAVGIRIMLTKEAKREPNYRASTGSYARPFATIFRSTSCAGATWTRALRSSLAIPTRDLSSTI